MMKLYRHGHFTTAQTAKWTYVHNSYVGRNKPGPKQSYQDGHFTTAQGQNGHIFTVNMMAAINQGENKPYQQATTDTFYKSFYNIHLKNLPVA